MLRARGGIHNRVTVQLPIAPFTLKECEDYAASQNLGFDRGQIAECYMALGGVAYYWSLLREGESVAQSFDRLFFGDFAVMRDEFTRLFSSLFKMERRHVEIVKALAGKKSGMMREELLAALGESSNGDVSECLSELVECGFVRRYSQPGRVKRGGRLPACRQLHAILFPVPQRMEGQRSAVLDTPFPLPKVECVARDVIRAGLLLAHPSNQGGVGNLRDRCGRVFVEKHGSRRRWRAD